MKIFSPIDNKYLKQMTECQIQMAKETEGMNLNENTVFEGMSEVIHNQARGKYYLAVENEKLLGMLLVIPEWSDWRAKEVWWIHSVYIYPEYRGKKIYSEIYQHLKNRILDNDQVAGLRLYVDKTNSKAIKVYRALGMTDEHYALFEWMK